MAQKRLNKRDNPLTLQSSPEKPKKDKEKEGIFDLALSKKSFALFLLLNQDLLKAYQAIFPNETTASLLDKIMLENLKTNHPKTYARLVKEQEDKAI